MLNDELLEKIFSHKDMRVVPIGYQSTVVSVIGEVLADFIEINEYALIKDLLD